MRVMLLEEIIIRLLALIEKIVWKVVFEEIIRRMALFEVIMWRVILSEEIIRRLFCFRRQETIRFLRTPRLLGRAC